MKRYLIACLLLLGFALSSGAEDRRPIRFVDPTIKSADKPDVEAEEEGPVTLESLTERVRQLEKRLGPPTKESVHLMEKRLEKLEELIKELDRKVRFLETQVRLRR